MSRLFYYIIAAVLSVENTSGTTTLTIESGTLIRGIPGILPSGGNPGTPEGVTDAQGIASCPIVFTS
ncbi:hypothetical protein AAHN97_02440 [Chitinophaga niabensis]|uniref:hypothetical protein n=1 Tax=Chitinophaga niabensis TaxID=536979 RepID=UPI0031BB44B8